MTLFRIGDNVAVIDIQAGFLGCGAIVVGGRGIETKHYHDDGNYLDDNGNYDRVATVQDTSELGDIIDDAYVVALKMTTGERFYAGSCQILRHRERL
jgi:hypothetical protein